MYQSHLRNVVCGLLGQGFWITEQQLSHLSHFFRICVLRIGDPWLLKLNQKRNSFVTYLSICKKPLRSAFRAQKTRPMKLKMQIKLPMKAKSPYRVMLFSCKGRPLRSTDLMGLAVTWKSPPITVVDHDDKNEGLRITAALPNTVCVNPRSLS